MEISQLKKTGGKEGLNCIAEFDENGLALMSAPCKEKTFGPLRGMPVLIKDNIDVKNLHTRAGSLALSDNLADKDAPVVERLRKNGAIILGKTNMTEFLNFTASDMPLEYSCAGGYIVNADNPGISPGGSSGGSAVAVAAGLVPAALGTDTSFSVIACAGENGICGLKPPVGALPSEGIVSLTKTLDSVGVLAKNLSDALRVYSCMRDTPLSDINPIQLSGMRLGINTARWETLKSSQADFISRVLGAAAKERASLSYISEGPVPEVFTIMKCEFKEQLEAYLRSSNSELKTLSEIVEFYEANPEKMMKYGDDLLKAALETGTNSDEYEKAIKKRNEMRVRITEELCAFDAVIMTGLSDIMHFCGLPSVCISSGIKNENGINRCLILYGTNEERLYGAALGLEELLLSMQSDKTGF